MGPKKSIPSLAFAEFSPVFAEAEERIKVIQGIRAKYGDQIDEWEERDLAGFKVDIEAKVRSLRIILKYPTLNVPKTREEAEQKSIELARACWEAQEYCDHLERKFIKSIRRANVIVPTHCVPGQSSHCVRLDGRLEIIEGKQCYPVFYVLEEGTPLQREGVR